MIERVPRFNESCVDWSPRERLERYGADELERRSREHDIDYGAALREEPRQPRRLVAGYASRDTEEDAAGIKWTNGLFPATAGDHPVFDLAFGQLFERPGRQLFLAR